MERHPLRRAAFWAVLGIPLGGWGAPAAPEFDACLRRLADPDFETREAAYRRILDWGAADPEGVRKRLPAAHDDHEVQAHCRQLRERVLWEARYRKMALHADGYPDLALAAQGFFDGTPVTEAAVRLVETAGDRKKEAAAMLLAFLEGEPEPSAGERPAAAVKGGRESDSPEMVRSSIISHFAVLGQPWTARPLLRYLRGPFERVRCQTAFVIARLDAPEVVPEIVSLLSDGDPDARAGAALVLSQLKAESAIPALERLLAEGKDPPQVRAWALKAVISADADQVCPVLERSLEDPALQVRQWALSEINFRKLKPLLPAAQRRLDDEHPTVRHAALQTVCLMGSAEHAASVARLLADSDKGVRKYAIVVLGHFRDPAWAPAIAEFLDDPDKDLQLAAAQTLATLFGWKTYHPQDPLPETRRLWRERQAREKGTPAE